MVLKLAAGVYENVFAYVYVFAEVGVERRKDAQRRVDIRAEEPRKQSANLFGRVVRTVQFERNAAGFVARLVHKRADVGGVERLAPRGDFEKFFECHFCQIKL